MAVARGAGVAILPDDNTFGGKQHVAVAAGSNVVSFGLAPLLSIASGFLKVAADALTGNVPAALLPSGSGPVLTYHSSH